VSRKCLGLAIRVLADGEDVRHFCKTSPNWDSVYPTETPRDDEAILRDDGRVNCLPESGGCERPFTDAFVDHLNRLECSRYKDRACLDVDDRVTAQPEALYVDDQTSHSLVIERKSLPWPIDFVHKHKNDHAAAHIIQKRLEGLSITELYELQLPMLISGRQKDVEAFARGAGDAIRRNWRAITSGSRFKGRQGDMWWRFGQVPDDARQDDNPASGIKVTWTGPSLTFEDFIDLEHPSGGVAGEGSKKLHELHSQLLLIWGGAPGAGYRSFGGLALQRQRILGSLIQEFPAPPPP
jgi:hypothetical protein